MERAETAVLRMANDQYRKAIFNAQVYANSGAGTYEKPADMATRDMLSRGLNCVQYANGARHTLADYADMAIRTASKRAYLQGEGEKRQEWGISTVIMAKRGNPCPKCLPFVGKVLIDDVWSRQYAERQVERFGRLAEYSLSPDNKRQYEQKRKEWEERAEERKLTLDEEGAILRYISPSSIALNDKLRAGEELTDFEKEWIMNLNQALDKLPEFKGNLSRSLDFPDNDMAQEFFDRLNTEEVFPQYISATKEGVYNPEGQVQIFIQNSKKGKDLKGLNDMEREVLYPINTKFRVVNKVKQGDKFYILLEEVE